MYRQSCNAQISLKSHPGNPFPQTSRTHFCENSLLPAIKHGWWSTGRISPPFTAGRRPLAGRVFASSSFGGKAGDPAGIQSAANLSESHGGQMRISRGTGSFGVFFGITPAKTKMDTQNDHVTRKGVSLGEICPEIGSNNHQHPPTNH